MQDPAYRPTMQVQQLMLADEVNVEHRLSDSATVSHWITRDSQAGHGQARHGVKRRAEAPDDRGVRLWG